MFDYDYVTKVEEYIVSVYVYWKSGKVKIYDAKELTYTWFNTSNDRFYELYGFNYVPSSVYQDWYRRKYFGE